MMGWVDVVQTLSESDRRSNPEDQGIRNGLPDWRREGSCGVTVWVEYRLEIRL